MPTGSGKTGVIATVASIRARERPVLIVSPSTALTVQLKVDVDTKFWNKVQAESTWLPEHTFLILPSLVSELLEALDSQGSGRLVLFATIQALLQLQSENPQAYRKLKSRIGTVIFDEGHREPAPVWAEVVRGFEVPVILSTATPFRNDLKLFNVDNEHVYFLSFRDAVGRLLIREVEIVETQRDGAREFARQLIARRDTFVADGRFPATTKVIVRCASEESVTEMHNALIRALKGRSEGVLAVHDQFRRGHASLLGSVPAELRERNERFLVHQFMLTEGIDDPSCAIVAIYEPFTTARQLIQQIGRVIRHPNPQSASVAAALVIGCVGDEVQKVWNSYLEFDSECQKAGGRPPIRTGFAIARDLIGALPEIDYSFGRFRRKVPLDSEAIDEHLRVPQSCVIFRIGKKFDLVTFGKEIQKSLYEIDRDVLRNGGLADADCRFHVSLGLVQSELLEDALFQEPTLHVTIYACHGEYLFYYDSGGLWIDELTGVVDRVAPAALRSYLPDGSATAITMLAVKNSDIGPFSLRSRQLNAPSVAIAVPFMGEHMNVITRAAGRTQDTRRYVGFERARVRDGERIRGSVDEFFAWTKKLWIELSAAARGATLFQRFALPVDVPADTSPANILFDSDEIASEFVEQDGSADLRFADICVDVDGGGRDPANGFPFRIAINGVEQHFWIRWDAKKSKYILKSSDLEGFRLKGNPRMTLVKWLNQRQPFRIIPVSSGAIYASGRFYGIDLRLEAKSGAGAALLDLMEPMKELSVLRSEKGKVSGQAAGWPSDTVFGLIDASVRPGRGPGAFARRFDTVVCDDLNDECADFVCLDKDAVVLIHAKAGNGSQVAASHIYDVCSQAVKNLAFLKSDNQELPGDGGKWNQPWKQLDARVRRIRCGQGTGANIRARMMELRRRPTTRRQVWLVLGGLLSRSAVERELQRAAPKAQLIQAYHLLTSLHSSCQSLGVELRIFCSE